MSGNIEGLNLNVEEEAKGMTDYGALPEGEYQVIVSQAEMKDNKSGQGQHVSCTLQVIEGDCEGRLTWANFNVSNLNPTAEKIGRAELASLCQSIGIANPKDTSELLDKPFGIKLGIDRKDPTRNKIKAYFALTDAPTTKPAAPVVATAPVAKPAAGAKKPWHK